MRRVSIGRCDMSIWSRIGNVLRGDRLSREIDEEFAAHIQEALAEGRDPAEARQAFGSALRQRALRLVVGTAGPRNAKSGGRTATLVSPGGLARARIRPGADARRDAFVRLDARPARIGREATRWLPSRLRSASWCYMPPGCWWPLSNDCRKHPPASQRNGCSLSIRSRKALSRRLFGTR
jgi:hypothetical protein